MKKLLFLTIVGCSFYLYKFLLANYNDEVNQKSDKTSSIESSTPKDSTMNERRNNPATKVKNKKIFNIKNVENSNIDYGQLDTFESGQSGFYINSSPLENKGHVIMGDILLPFDSKSKGKKKLVGKIKKWEEGIIPYTIDSSLYRYKEIIRNIQQALLEMNNQTIVKWVKRVDEEDFITFTYDEKNCLSNVGKIGGQQFIYLNTDCAKGNILHEMMHTLGFFHEHSRPDRDHYLIVYWDNIDKNYWDQFRKVPKKFWPFVDVEFDLYSLLLYPPEAFALDSAYASMSTLDGKLYQVQRESLSQLDIEKINLYYSSE